MQKYQALPTARFSPWFVVTACLFVTCLIMANILSGARFFTLPLDPFHLFGSDGNLSIDGGTIIFPVAYIVSDVLTEVYGYRMARVVIWIGFVCNLLAVGAIYLLSLLPDAAGAEHQLAYSTIFGLSWKILLASFVAYLIGEFANSFVLAKMKVWTRGHYLWTRTIGSTLIGEGLDSVIFGTLAFSALLGRDALTLDGGLLVGYVLSQWLLKTLYETLATPLTYLVIGRLKQAEQSDAYDYDTDFNPFNLSSTASA